MKRSEMVELIWNFVQNIENDYDKYMCEEDCDELLNLIEEKGMLPPDYNQNAGSSPVPSYFVNEWESE